MHVVVSVVSCSVFVGIAGCKYALNGTTGSAAPFSDELLASLGTPYVAEPKNAKLLNGYGDIALFSGETDADADFNVSSLFHSRNSLFLRKLKEGKDEWRLLLTSAGDWRWRDADGMDESYKKWMSEIRENFNVHDARFAKDGHRIWLVCKIRDFHVVCRFDFRENTMRCLCEGGRAEEQPDGTVRVRDRHICICKGGYFAIVDSVKWITPDGNVIKKDKPVSCRLR